MDEQDMSMWLRSALERVETATGRRPTKIAAKPYVLAFLANAIKQLAAKTSVFGDDEINVKKWPFQPGQQYLEVDAECPECEHPKARYDATEDWYECRGCGRWFTAKSAKRMREWREEVRRYPPAEAPLFMMPEDD